MRYVFTFVLSILLMGVAQAQDCQTLSRGKSVQRVIDQQTGTVNYWGIGSIDSMQADDTGIIYLMVGKSVAGEDTTYKVSILTGSLGTPDNMKGVTLTFADGTTISKPDQPIKAEGSGGLYSLSVETILTKAEFLELGRKPLSAITVMGSMSEVPKGLSASILGLVPCVINTW